MTPKVRGAGHLTVIVLVSITSSTVAAQPIAGPPTQSGTGHSVWRDTLIGTGVGTAAGLMVGKMRENFHNTECRVLDCNRVFEMDTLGPIGAATGAVVGFMVHRLFNHGGEARSAADGSSARRTLTRSPSVMLAPSLSRTRKAILLQAEF